MEKILFVDQGDVLAEVYTRVLEKEGYEVHVVSKWDEALSLIEKCKPNMILFGWEKNDFKTEGEKNGRNQTEHAAFGRSISRNEGPNYAWAHASPKRLERVLVCAV